MSQKVNKWAIGLLSAGLLVGGTSSPALAQDSGRANTAEDFRSAEQSNGLFGTNMNIWDLVRQAGTLNGAGVVDDGFRRSQSRQINRQAESLRERQQAILDQRASEEAGTSTTPTVAQ
ncbi:MAG: hypothetical protein DCF15_10900 [Phormidesmis priestleyi]|uniref:Porin n=1 Tax=Phormidesmis priestleyi TaxID=268141 RepID=A0A2W4XDX2_9CYAN|nr:MAG: hypothetical protein DCF15_10900 [Phormidesmis priestleyi]